MGKNKERSMIITIILFIFALCLAEAFRTVNKKLDILLEHMKHDDTE